MSIENIISFITIAGIIQGFVLSNAVLSLRTKKNESPAYLSLLILLFSTGAVLYIIVNRYLETYVWHKYIIIFVYALFSPLYYFYIAAFTGRNYKLTHPGHYAIFISMFFTIGVYLTNFLPFYTIKTSYKISTVLLSIQSCVYFSFSIAAILNYRKKIKEYYSTGNNYRLIWILYFMITYLTASIGTLIGDIRVSNHKMLVFALIISILVYATGYISIRRPAVLTPFEKPSKKKYEKTALTKEKLSEYDLKLQEAINNEIYIDSEISLPVLAKKIGIQSYQLSQVINNRGVNFYEFINSLRIDYAKKQILDNDDVLNITHIAYDSGFNSISAFNSAFKRFTKMTPTQFAARKKG